MEQKTYARRTCLHADLRSKSNARRRLTFWTLLGVLCLLAVWQAAASVAGEALLLPAPLPVLRRFFVLAATPRFHAALGASFARLALALCLSVPLGIAVGLAAGLSRPVEAFLRPLFALITATPVMAIILILFLMFGSEKTPSIAAFLVVFPVLSANTIAGMRGIDRRLREVFDIYGMGFAERLKHLYLPALSPFIYGGLRSSLSLCWKVLVAAEVLVQPALSLGAGMQNAKSALETTELFAWTLAAITAAAITAELPVLVNFVLKTKGSGLQRKH